MQLLCSRTCSACQPLVGWLVDSPPSPHAPPRLASPSRRERGECSAAEGHQDADYECGVGLLRLNQLDLVTVVASPATVRRSATVPSPQEQLISQSGLPQCVRLSFTGREEEQLCLQHCPWTTTQPCRGQRLAGGDDKHSQPNAELAKGRQVRMPCAPVDSTPAQQRLALLNKNSRHGSTMCMYHLTHQPATVVLSAALHDLNPHFLSIASSGSPECRMRCAIAHF